MKILEEYARLQKLYSTEVGRKLIDEQWMVASNYVKYGENDWRKRGNSSGNEVAGFAFDIKTSDIETTPKGYFDHSDAKSSMLRKILDGLVAKPLIQMSQKEQVRYIAQLDTFESRVIDGRLAYVPEWSFPLATVYTSLFNLDKESLNLLEKTLLNKKIGLPLFNLQLAAHRGLI